MNSQIFIPDPIQKILHTLQQAGFEAWLAGGCVRDGLMDRACHDYDLCTSAHPEQVRQLFDKCIPTGLKHGTVTVLEEGIPVEITTFRKETGYSDHRRPDAVEFVDSLQEDLARRDFTINAMAYNKEKGLQDPFGGQEDLEKGIIRCVGDPQQRYAEDALRMLRALRFAARFHFRLDDALLEAMKTQEEQMQHVSVERVRPELEEIMKEGPEYLEQAAPLLKKWIPELEECLHTAQNSKWHYTDVLHHTIDAMKYMEPYSPQAAWALLLHDTGKPAAKTTSEDGIDHFKKHSLYSAKIARRVLKDFGFSRKDAEKIAQLVLHHDDHLKPALKTIYKYRVENGWDAQMMEDFLAVQKGDILAHSDLGKDRIEQWQAFKDFYEQEKDRRPLSLKELAVSGRDLEAAFQLKGRDVGAALKKALEYAFYHPEKNTKEDLLAFLSGRKGEER